MCLANQSLCCGGDCSLLSVTNKYVVRQNVVVRLSLFRSVVGVGELVLPVGVSSY
jgi:hypothetical protein